MVWSVLLRNSIHSIFNIFAWGDLCVYRGNDIYDGTNDGANEERKVVNSLAGDNSLFRGDVEFAGAIGGSGADE